MTFAPGIAEFINKANKVLPPQFHQQPLAVQRRMYENLTAAFPFDFPPTVTTNDIYFSYDQQSIRLRFYRPQNIEKNAPCLVYCHGGGFVLGSLHTHDTLAAEIALYSNTIVVAVDFRPAPEFHFPTQLNDCYEAVNYISRHATDFSIDRNRIAISGDSSGANLAVGVCLKARDNNQGRLLCAQILISPVLDFSRWQSGGVDAPLLTSDEMIFFTCCYTGPQGDIRHPYLSPLQTAKFYDLPKAYILAAEQDSLCVDSTAYAHHLTDNGIPCRLVIEKGFVHACVRARALSPAVAKAFADLCDAIKDYLTLKQG